MAKLAQMLTANRLRDGDVVYWRDGGWVEALGVGEIFPDDGAADAALKAADASVKARVVVNPYLFEIHDDGGRARPVKEREIIRAAGPTVRPDLGKQSARHVQV